MVNVGEYHKKKSTFLANTILWEFDKNKKSAIIFSFSTICLIYGHFLISNLKICVLYRLELPKNGF